MRIDRYYLDEWEVHIEERQFLAGLRRIYWFFTFLLFGTLQFKSIIIGDYNIFGTYTILLIIVVLLEWQAPFLPSPRTSITLSAILSFYENTGTGKLLWRVAQGVSGWLAAA